MKLAQNSADRSYWDCRDKTDPSLAKLATINTVHLLAIGIVLIVKPSLENRKYLNESASVYKQRNLVHYYT